MTKLTRAIGVTLALLLLPLAVGAQNQMVRQWASSADATSEYTSTSWSAQQAVGAPDSRQCADMETAWASETVSDFDALTLFYDQPVFATQVGIFQNYNPGAIVEVQLIPADGSAPIPIPNSVDTETPCPGVFTLDFAMTDVPVFGVRVILEQSLIGDWNEIDAVQLVGAVANVQAVSPAQVPPATRPGGGAPGPGGPGANPSTSGGTGITVNCDSGVSFDNGVGMTVVQMRSGFNYTATAIGLDGFDPILAVLGEDGTGLCTDDDGNAAQYSANLPTTGQIVPATTNSQVPFANNSPSVFADIELVVGGYNNQPGEFLLILEGMTFSSADGAGDIFSVEVTDTLAASGVLNAYVISVTNAYDPTLALVDADLNYLTDRSGSAIICDDAGNPSLCWGDSFPLSSSYVSRTQGRQLPGGPFDASLSIPVVPTDAGGFYNFLVNSAGNTYGDYVMVFHMGIQ